MQDVSVLYGMRGSTNLASLAVSHLRKCYGEIAIRITVKRGKTQEDGRKGKAEGDGRTDERRREGGV